MKRQSTKAIALCLIAAAMAICSVAAASPVVMEPIAQLGGRCAGFAQAGDYLIVCEGTGVSVLQVPAQERATATQLFNRRLPTPAESVAVHDDWAVVAAGESGIYIFDLSRLPELHLTGQLDTPGSALDVEFDGEYAYVADGAAGLLIVDARDRRRPMLLGHVPSLGRTTRVRVSGQRAFTCDTVAVVSHDIAHRGAPHRVEALWAESQGEEFAGLDLEDGFVYTAKNRGPDLTATVLRAPVSGLASAEVMHESAAIGEVVDLDVLAGAVAVATARPGWRLDMPSSFTVVELGGSSEFPLISLAALPGRVRLDENVVTMSGETGLLVVPRGVEDGLYRARAYPALSGARDMSASGGLLAMASADAGVVLLQTQSGVTTRSGSLYRGPRSEGNRNAVCLYGADLFASADFSVHWFDVAKPHAPSELSVVKPAYRYDDGVSDIALSGTGLSVTYRDRIGGFPIEFRGLRRYVISNRGAFSESFYRTVGGNTVGALLAADTNLEMAADPTGLVIVSGNRIVVLPRSLIPEASHQGIGLIGTVAVAARDSMLIALDLFSLDEPQRTSMLRIAGPVADLKTLGTFVYVAEGGAGVEVFDYSDPANPMLIATAPVMSSATAIESCNGLLYVTDSEHGLLTYELPTPWDHALRALTASGSHDSMSDVNGDGVTDAADLAAWLR